MKLAMIYARGRNGCIGDAGKLPWHLPDEFRHFKRTTMGCPVIMGRRTYEDHNNVLPGRTNVVLTSDPTFTGAEGLVVRPSLDAALADFRELDSEVFIIGGAALFANAFNAADVVYETVVDGDFDGDTFLTPLVFDGFDCAIVERHAVDDRHAYAWEARKWERR